MNAVALEGRQRRQNIPGILVPSPTDAADAWNVVEMRILADDFQVEFCRASAAIQT